MDSSHLLPVGQVIAAIVALRLIELVVTYFFKKLTRVDQMDSEYITKVACDACRFQQSNRFSAIENQLSEIKGILLVVATKCEIPIEDLKGLTKNVFQKDFQS